jgi:hypothetical protein
MLPVIDAAGDRTTPSRRAVPGGTSFEDRWCASCPCSVSAEVCACRLKRPDARAAGDLSAPQGQNGTG